jgi:hypothetical protein
MVRTAVVRSRDTVIQHLKARQARAGGYGTLLVQELRFRENLGAAATT